MANIFEKVAAEQGNIFERVAAKEGGKFGGRGASGEWSTPYSEDPSIAQVSRRIPLALTKGAISPFVDLIALGMRQIPGVGENEGLEMPVGGSRWVEEQMRLQAPDYEPGFVGKAMEGGVEGLGAATSMAALPLTWATKIKAAAEGGNKAAKLVNVFTRMAQENPELFFAVEQKMGIVGGAAGRAASQLVPDDSPWLKMAAEVIGNIAGGTAVTATGAIRRAIREAGSDARAARQVFSGTKENPFTTPRFEEAMDLQEAVPGMQLTTAQATGDPGIATVALGRGSMPGQQYTPQEMLRRGATVKALREQVDPEKLFQVDGAPATLERGVASVRNRLQNVFDQRTQQFSDALNTLGSRTDKATASKVLREVLVAEERNLDDAINSAYKQVGNPKIPFEKFYADLVRLRDEFPELASAKNLPSELDTTIAKLTPEPTAAGPSQIEPRALDELRRWRSDLLDEIRAERAGDYPRPKKIALLEQMRQAADTALSDAEAGGVVDVEKLREANELFRRVANELGFRRETVDKLLAPGAKGAARAIPDEMVGQTIFKSGEAGRKAVRDYLQAFTDNPEARANAVKALEDYAAADLRAIADTPDGLTAARLGAWKARYKEVLDELPELKSRFGDVERARKRLEMMRTGAERGTPAEGPVKATNRKIFDLYFGDTPENVAREAMKSDRSMARAIALTRGDKAAREGLREGVWKLIDKDVSATVVGPADVKEFYRAKLDFLTDNARRRVLRKLFSEEEMALWDRVKRTMDFIAQADRPPTVKGSDTAVRQGAASYLTGGLYWLAGRNLPQAMVTPYIAKFFKVMSDRFTHEQVLRIVDEALADPAAAKVLYQTATEINEKAANNAIKRLAVRAGIQSATETLAKPGETKDGKVFIGGDPADPNNWKKLRRQ